MILVDTSIWIDHLRRGDERLMTALDAGLVRVHPFVVGELACGHLHNRAEILELLDNLPSAQRATDPEARTFIGSHALMGRGIGYVDVHLLASVALSGSDRLWTRDRRLAQVAGELGMRFDPATLAP